MSIVLKNSGIISGVAAHYIIRLTIDEDTYTVSSECRNKSGSISRLVLYNGPSLGDANYCYNQHSRASE